MFTNTKNYFSKLGLGKEKMYNLVKRPDELVKKVTEPELSTQIHTFQKAPNTNFMSVLNKRFPTHQTFKIEKPLDFGLKKDLLHKGQFQMENAGKTSKILNERVSNNSAFKQSTGVPSLNKYFNKIAPKNMDYRYVDPQTYEYKLKGMTQDKLILNKMREEGEKANVNPDPDVLDLTSKFLSWREQDKNNKVNKIAKAYRNYAERDAFNEGLQAIDIEGEGDEEIPISEVIKTGKALRKNRLAPGIQEMKNKYQMMKEKKEPDDEFKKDIEKEETEKKKFQTVINNVNKNLTPKQQQILRLQLLADKTKDPELLKGIKQKDLEEVHRITRNTGKLYLTKSQK
jgi:heterodisulfide reductase subunit C